MVNFLNANTMEELEKEFTTRQLSGSVTGDNSISCAATFPRLFLSSR
jgi:hypothetical protein